MPKHLLSLSKHVFVCHCSESKKAISTRTISCIKTVLIIYNNNTNTGNTTHIIPLNNKTYSVESIRADG